MNRLKLDSLTRWRQADREHTYPPEDSPIVFFSASGEFLTEDGFLIFKLLVDADFVNGRADFVARVLRKRCAGKVVSWWKSSMVSENDPDRSRVVGFPEGGGIFFLSFKVFSKSINFCKVFSSNWNASAIFALLLCDSDLTLFLSNFELASASLSSLSIISITFVLGFETLFSFGCSSSSGKAVFLRTWTRKSKESNIFSKMLTFSKAYHSTHWALLLICNISSWVRFSLC